MVRLQCIRVHKKYFVTWLEILRELRSFESNPGLLSFQIFNFQLLSVLSGYHVLRISFFVLHNSRNEIEIAVFGGPLPSLFAIIFTNVSGAFTSDRSFSNWLHISLTKEQIAN